MEQEDAGEGMSEVKLKQCKDCVFLKKVIKAQDRLLTCYRLGSQPPEWVFNDLDKAREKGIL